MVRHPLTFKMIRLVLRPIVRMLIRHGHGFPEALEALRYEFISVAFSSLQADKHEVNTSRLSAMTGIGRREVTKVLKAPLDVTNQATLTARVLGFWEQSESLRDEKGKPKRLKTDGKDSDFFKLVESVSKDINPYTLLFELERNGSIVRKEDNTIELVKREFISRNSPEDSIELLSNDLDDFSTAVDENIFLNRAVPNLHLKTEYTNVRIKDLAQIESWLIKEGSIFHEKVRNFIAKHDVDINPETFQQTGVKKDIAGARVAIGTFSRIVSPKGE